MGNVSSHDPALQEKFSIIKVVFFAHKYNIKAAAIGCKNFKCHYRKLLLNHVLSQIDGSNLNASEIVKSVNVLTAI